MEGENWVPLYLRYDKETDTVKMRVDNKDDFPIAAGLLMRISLKATQDMLVEEAERRKENGNQESNQ